jgi:hypothetical protein
MLLGAKGPKKAFLSFIGLITIDNNDNLELQSKKV